MTHLAISLLTTQDWVTLLTAIASTAVSEIGDRSMFTASVLALQHGIWLVFSATFMALFVQSLCSVAAGGLVGKFIRSRGHGIVIKVIAAVLFGLFAAQHYWEAYNDRKDEIRQQEREQQRISLGTDGATTGTDLEADSASGSGSLDAYVSTDSCGIVPEPATHTKRPDTAAKGTGNMIKLELRQHLLEDVVHGNTRRSCWAERLDQSLTSSVETELFQLSETETVPLRSPSSQLVQYSTHWWKVFTLVYLAEIGDTSMLVTMTLASNRNVYMVFLGSMIANALVNFIGIWAARTTAKYISDFWVNLCAGVMFTIFTCFTVLETAELAGKHDPAVGAGLPMWQL